MAYDEAWQIFWDRIYQGKSKVLIHRLGRADRALQALKEFFPGADLYKDPLVNNRRSRQDILNEVGLRLADLGELHKAIPFYQRAADIARELKDWSDLSSIYQDLAETHAYEGQLAKSVEAASEAVSMARRASDAARERYSLARLAWAAHLRGELSIARQAYRDAETLEKKLNPGRRHLFALRGVQYAEHLRRTGDFSLGRQVTEENLRIAESFKWTRNISQCHRVLADLDGEMGAAEAARKHYDVAIAVARAISRQDVLLEALLARGRWFAKRGEVSAARVDLNEALDFAAKCGYRIYEIDVHIARAWADHAEGRTAEARFRVEEARESSAGLGYYWGGIDAASMLRTAEGNL